MASTPKKVITEENECFICKNATNSERRIKVFGRSSINLAELIKRAVNVNLGEFEKTNAMFVCSKCYKQLIRLDGLIKSTGNLCDELQRIFQQRGPVRFKRLASESPQTPRLRPKSLIMDYEDPAQTSQSKSNVCQLAATPNSCPNISYPAVSVTPSNISQQNRFSLVMKAFPYVQFEPTKSSTPSKKKRIPNTVGSTVTDGVSKVSITVEFPSKTVRKELSAELSSLVFGPDDRIA